MKIKRLNIISFGKFKNKEIILKDGLNLIYGKNEAGKSTVSAFIRFMLYAFPKEKASKNNPVPDKEKFIPWSGDFMEGAMEATDAGKEIKIIRTQKKTSSTRVINSITGEELKEYNGIEPGNILLDSDAETFERTAFIRQNELEVSTSSELESRLRNLVSGGEEDLSYNDAKAGLESAIRKIDRPNAGILAQVQREIINLEEKLITSKGQYDKWLEIETEMSMFISQRDEVEKEIIRLQTRFDGQQGYQAAQRLEKIKECEASLHEYEERLLKIDSELDKNGVIPDESFLKEVKRLTQDLRIISEKARLCKEDVKAAKLRIDDKAAQMKAFERLIGNEEKITENLKKASKTRNRILLIIGALFNFAMFVSLFGSFVGLSFNLVMFIFGCICGVAGMVLLIIYWSTRGKARADRIASSYGFSSSGELLSKIEELKGLKKEISILESEFERHKEREKSEEEKQFEVQKQLDRMGEMRGITSLTPSGAELMCSEIETLLNRRQTAISNLELYESKKSALLEGTNIEELETQAEKASSQQDDLSTPALLDNINNAKERHRELLLKINSLHFKQKDIIKASDTPDEIMTEILALKEKKERIIKNRSALERSLHALNKAYEHISMVFAPKLCSDAGELFNSISNGKRELLIDSANNVKISEDGRIKELLYFSTGTKDAAYISVRLAICGLIFGEKCPPIIFDDTFAHFDLDRLNNAVALLRELSKDKQVILFTCREEEKRLCRDFANIIEL